MLCARAVRHAPLSYHRTKHLLPDGCKHRSNVETTQAHVRVEKAVFLTGKA